jgi:hypothetical protein
MSNTSKDVQLDRDFGTTPSSRFPLRFRAVKEQSAGNVSYILPMRLFLFSFRTNMELIGKRHCGIVPLKELLDRSRYLRDVVLHIDSGICPWNLLLERDKKAVLLM